jgi:hypothetical protein
VKAAKIAEQREFPPYSSIFAADVPVLAVDNSEGPNAETVYLALANFNGAQMQIGVTRSTDNGNTWSAATRVSNSWKGDELAPWLSVSPQGILGVTWLDRREDGNRYQPYYAISRDGGASFEGDLPLSATLSDPRKISDHLIALRTHSWVDDAMYVIWPDTRSGGVQLMLGGIQF